MNDLLDNIPRGPQNLEQLLERNPQMRTMPGNRSQVQVGTYRGHFGNVPIVQDAMDALRSQQPTLLDQGAAIAKGEYRQTQAAADRQFARNNQQIDAFGNLLDSAPSRFARIAGQADNGIEALMGGLQGEADRNRGDFDNYINEFIDMADGSGRRQANAMGQYVKDGVKAYNTAADRAEGAARDAITGYSKGIQEDAINATVAGIRQNVEAERAMIEAGIGPGGIRLTPAERADALRKLKFDTSMQISTMAAGVRQQAQNTMASLRTNLADVIERGGRMRAAGAELGMRGEQAIADAGDKGLNARASALNARAENDRIRQGYMNLITGLGQFRAQQRSGIEMASLNYEMEGRGAMAQMVKENPETVVSFLSAYLTLAGIATAPGGRIQGGLNL